MSSHELKDIDTGEIISMTEYKYDLINKYGGIMLTPQYKGF